MKTISSEILRDALIGAGLRAGDSVLMHSDAMVAAQVPPMSDERRLDLVIETVLSVLGPQGTLVMPAFTYSFTKGEPFELRRTPSTVGMITERFRAWPEVSRTADPIFSFAIRGPLAPELCALPTTECFGPESVMAALHRLNCLILCVGCPLSRGGTFVHYVEKFHGVNYRYDKTFSGTIVWPDGRSTTNTVVYYVRDLARKSGADLRRLQARLLSRGLMRATAAGRGPILGVRAGDFFRTACEMLDEDPVSLIEEGAAIEEAASRSSAE